MLEACKALTDIDFNYFKRQIESNEIKKKKFQEKGIKVFDISNEILIQTKIILVIPHFHIMILKKIILLLFFNMTKLMG